MIEEKVMEIGLNYGLIGIVVVWFMIVNSRTMKKFEEALQNNTLAITELKTLIQVMGNKDG